MNYIENLIVRIPAFASQKEAIEAAVDAICEMYRNGGKLLLAGNGGSAADCEHISGELLKGFLKKRPYPGENPALVKLQQGIAAIPLPSLSSSVTAFMNDVAPSLVFAQLVGALGQEKDVFFGISTSGNSKNIIAAVETAKARGLKTIALTGKSGGAVAKLCDIAICVPEDETYLIQELHLPVYHAICAECEERIFEV